jgi:hypothetical protein
MLRTGRLPAPHRGRSSPASTPGSRPTPGVLLPGTLASPRTGLTPAGCRELVARLRRGALLSVVLGARAAGRTFLQNQPDASAVAPGRPLSRPAPTSAWTLMPLSRRSGPWPTTTRCSGSCPQAKTAGWQEAPGDPAVAERANGCCANTCPGLPICAASARPIWTASPPNATTALDSPSADPRRSDSLTGPRGGVALTPETAVVLAVGPRSATEPEVGGP